MKMSTNRSLISTVRAVIRANNVVKTWKGVRFASVTAETPSARETESPYNEHGLLRAEWHTQKPSYKGISGDMNNESRFPVVSKKSSSTLQRHSANLGAARAQLQQHLRQASVRSMSTHAKPEVEKVLNDPADFRPPSLKEDINPFMDVPTPETRMAETREGVDKDGGDYASEHLVDPTGGKVLEWLGAAPQVNAAPGKANQAPGAQAAS